MTPEVLISSINLIVTSLAIVIGYWYVNLQIKAAKEIEQEKRIIAVQSLIFELEYNKNIIEQYREHSEVGNNLGKSGDSYSYELNSPLFGNYQYLIQSCYTDIDLADKITGIYTHLQSCEVIVKQVQHLQANNLLIKETVINGRVLLRNEIIKLNNQLWDIGRTIVNSFDEPIKELTIIKNYLDRKVVKVG